jgi:hypothetical protein
VMLVSTARETVAKAFMGQEACSALDRMFIMQPSVKDAANMMRPCMEAISKAYELPVMVWPQDGGFTIYVGKDREISDVPFSKIMSAELSKRANSVFGYPAKVTVGWPSR